jgi:ribonucleoside-diphosphate reductase alpha chain
MMNESQLLLSQIVTYTKYSKFRPDLKRRETWEEIIDRYVGMMLKKYCGAKYEKQWKIKKVNVSESPMVKEIIDNAQYLYDKKVMPSMRMAQFAGKPIDINNSRGYNCAFLHMDHHKAFSEVMFLLLGGTGVGFSVQRHHVDKLPAIFKPNKVRKFLIGDSIEGWADAVNALMKAYFGITRTRPRFDYSDIREKGEPLVTSGGKAPGPDPLRLALVKIEAILNGKENDSKLTTVEVHDINCHIADAVLAGGIRRAALISLFSFGDKEMATCKHGQWWELNGQRGRSNNSVVLIRDRIKRKEFDTFWKFIKDSNSGEPGIVFSADKEWGFNPCAEISLRGSQFCNLTSIHGGTIKGQEDFNKRATVAAFFGTLQAGFTDFHYLRDVWQETTEKEALLGVSITGVGSNRIEHLNPSEAAKCVLVENARIAELIGINPAARATTIKPEGSGSLVMGTSSGIHAWWSPFYVRNVQCKIGDDLYNYFVTHHPDLIKDMDYQPKDAVIGIPIKAPDDCTLRSEERALVFLERVKRFNLEWVREGHRSGANYNNVSATCNVRDEEWDDVRDWMWINRKTFSGISVLPFDGGSYKDAPFTECTKYEYDKRMKYIKDNPVDLTKITELVDNTKQSENLACAGGACSLEY